MSKKSACRTVAGFGQLACDDSATTAELSITDTCWHSERRCQRRLKRAGAEWTKWQRLHVFCSDLQRNFRKIGRVLNSSRIIPCLSLPADPS